MDQNKRRVLMKVFIVSQLTYCRLVGIFHGRNNENRVNKIHEKALKLVYIDCLYLSFDELLIKVKSVDFIKEIFSFWQLKSFKVENTVSTGLTKDIFQFANKFNNLRNNSILLRKRNRTVFYGKVILF